MAMEVFNGVFMRTRPGLYSGAGIVRGLNRIPSELNCRGLKLCATSSLRRRGVGEISAFDDKGHMEYYNCSPVPVCGEERKKEKKKKKKMAGWCGVSEKKRAKLVKDLAKNLCMFSELGFGLETDEVKVKAISEAALVLQEHLEHLRAEGKKLKMEGKMDDSESSSSSESSDSECDNNEVVNMSILRNKVAAEQIVDEPMRSEGHKTMVTSPISLAMLELPYSQAEPKTIEEVGVVGLTVHNSEQTCTSAQLKRVEVCLGGKCKKMGAQVLMEEFSNVLGVGGSVVGCKCMGKCKTAPNVRIFNGDAVHDGEDDADDSVRSPSNPLYLGVGLDDVGFIVANYFGSELKQGCLGVSLDSATSPSVSL